MEPGAHLTRRYGISDYTAAIGGSVHVKGFVYVETDRFLPEAPPALTSASSSQKTDPAAEEKEEEEEAGFLSYIKEPLNEIAYLRRIAERQPEDGDGQTQAECDLMKGAVAWAPLNLGPTWLRRYLAKAEKVAGERTWKMIKGFRFLLQGIKDRDKFTSLALGSEWIECMKELGRLGFSFDVGVDQRQGGVWQLEIAGEMIKRLRQDNSNVILILSKCSASETGKRMSF
jgi:L-rhamnono-1,4-lactonase